MKKNRTELVFILDKSGSMSGLEKDRIDFRAIKPITEKEYFVGGSTALLDAIGKAIQKIGTVQMAFMPTGPWII